MQFRKKMYTSENIKLLPVSKTPEVDLQPAM